MDTQPLITYIRKYIQLTDEEVSLIRAKFQVKQYAKKQYIVQSDKQCRYLSFVLQGCLRTFFLDHDGKEHIVMLAIENWWVGDLGSFTEQTPAEFDIQCVEDSWLAQITNEDLEELFAAIPQLERFFRIIILRALIFSQRRNIYNFSLPAKERYLAFRNRYPEIEQRVPQYMIASYLGITKEFLSKIRSER